MWPALAPNEGVGVDAVFGCARRNLFRRQRTYHHQLLLPRSDSPSEQSNVHIARRVVHSAFVSRLDPIVITVEYTP
jgi:hypothetical protein